jgi:hypothetical protein
MFCIAVEDKKGSIVFPTSWVLGGMPKRGSNWKKRPDQSGKQREEKRREEKIAESTN